MSEPDLLKKPKFRPLVRSQYIGRTLDELLPVDHEARTVVAFVEQLDTSALNNQIKSRVGLPGAPAFDRKVLVSILLYSVIQGVYSFRKLEQLCHEHLAFMWLCGNDVPNYHTLSSFFSHNGVWLEQNLVRILALLRKQELIDFQEIAIDGRKIQANASSETSRRIKSLTEHLNEAQARYDLLKKHAEDKAGELSVQEAAALRACEDRNQRLQQALEQAQEAEQLRQKLEQERLQKAKEQEQKTQAKQQAKTKKSGAKTNEQATPNDLPHPQTTPIPESKTSDDNRIDNPTQTPQTQTPEDKTKESRANETDPDSRKMKFKDGGYGQGYNVQTTSCTATGLILALMVLGVAFDYGQLVPMVKAAEANTGQPAKVVMADAGYNTARDIQELEEAKIELLIPPKTVSQDKKANRDPYARKRNDTDEVAQCRARMGEQANRDRYSRCAVIAEGIHAQQSNRGFNRFRLRGLEKVKTEVLWQGLAHNFKVIASKRWLGLGKVRYQSKSQT